MKTAATPGTAVPTGAAPHSQIVPAEGTTGPVTPETRIWLVMGFFVLLGSLAALQPYLTGERREWIVYILATTLAPLVALAATKLAGRLSGQILLTLLGLLVGAGVVIHGYERVAALTGNPTVSAILAVPLALLLQVPVWWLAARLVGIPWQRRRPPDATFQDPDSRPWLFAVLSILAAGLLFRQTEFWFDGRIVICLLLISVTTWLTWRAWFVASSAPSAKAIRWIDISFYLVFALGTLTPLYPSSDGFMHHWSFYQGPISLVKAGGLLLWEVPSQYGFLSILLPALLPFREAASGLHAILSAMLFAQAVFVYRMICGVRTGITFRLWAGFAALVTVYHFCGDRGGLGGPHEYPSTGPYRTFWVFALTFLLANFKASESRPRNLWTQCAWTSVLLVFGSLWSIESAIYCLGTLGTTAIAEGTILTLWGSWRASGRSWLLRFVFPVLAVGAAVLSIRAYYRLRFGIAPDWFAFVEYGLSYTNNVGVLAVDPIGAALLLGLYLATVLTYATFKVLRTGDVNAAGLFAPYGAMIGTLSYFVARSHEKNAGNLIGLWFPFLFLPYLSAKEHREEAWTTTLRSLILPTFVVMSSMVLCLEPHGLTRLKAMFTQTPAPSVEMAMGRRFDHLFILIPKIRQKIGDLPLINISAYYPYTNLPSLPNEPWLPITPREEFLLLPPARKRLYLERFLERTDVPEGILFRRDPPAPWDVPDWRSMHDEMVQILNEVLPRYYELVETVSLDDEWNQGYRLERWRRR